MAVSPAARARLEDYEADHRVRANKTTHAIGIPLLAVSILGLLGRVPLPLGLDLGTVAALAAGYYYVRLDWRLGLPLALIALGLRALGGWLPSLLLAVAFAVGWVLQYAGHLVFERNQPAFHRNVEHLLVGPLWVFTRAVGAR